MLGLEHLAHAAGADAVEHDVLVEHQALGLPLVDGGGLIFGELVGEDQLPGESLSVSGAFFGREALLERREVGRREKPAFNQVLYELSQRKRHEKPPTRNWWCWPDSGHAPQAREPFGGGLKGRGQVVML